MNDDDMSLFEQKQNFLYKTESNEDYNTFKKPLMVSNPNNMSINSNFLVPTTIMGVGNTNNNNNNPNKNQLKHESTPIFDCNESIQQARRKYLMNQIDDLNSTMRGTGTAAPGAITTNRIYSTTTSNLIKQQQAQNKQQQQLKPIQSLNYISDKVKQPTHKSSLNISQYAALTNTAATAVVPIAQADLPKNLKKTIKDDFKKDKKNCIIQ
jgi:hypothetical protein